MIFTYTYILLAALTAIGISMKTGIEDGYSISDPEDIFLPLFGGAFWPIVALIAAPRYIGNRIKHGLENKERHRRQIEADQRMKDKELSAYMPEVEKAIKGR